MPIRASERGRYPKDWKDISDIVREIAGHQCQCIDQCGLHPWGRCIERHGEKARFAKGKVILTVAHLDHTPENCDLENLRAMCQRCHLRYDRDHHKETAKATREAKSKQGKLFDSNP